jgi:hypothetical protein
MTLTLLDAGRVSLGTERPVVLIQPIALTPVPPRVYMPPNDCDDAIRRLAAN